MTTTSGVYGADVSTYLSVASWQSLMGGRGVSLGIVRCYESGGEVDPNAPATVNNGWTAGLAQVDVYHFPCLSVDATTQVNDAVSALRAAGAKFVRYWIDVESGAGWSTTDFGANARFLQQLLDAAASLGLSVGIYTSVYEWSITINADQFSRYPLWYADYDEVASFADFTPFGGWTAPVMKQFAGNEAYGGVSYDGNWTPSLASQPGATSRAAPLAHQPARSAEEVRSCAVAGAQRVVGLDANPAASNALSYQSYVSFTTPGETSANQASYATMSGCGLVVAGIWRATGVWSSQLYAPYQIGTAISRLVSIAESAGAYTPYTSASAPSPGDMVLLDASGSDTHVYTVLTITPNATGYDITSVDGGQVDEQGYETILQKSRTWANGMDTVAAEGANPTSTRPITAWIDITKLPLLPAAPLWGYAQNGPSKTPGLDTSTVLDATGAAALAGAGYMFCVRTLSTTNPGAAGDLTRDEARAILGAGLAIMAIQRAGASTLTSANAASLGKSNGQAAALGALAAGLPMTSCLWLTLDGVPAGTSVTTAAAYANAWYKAVSKAGFTPGVYVGASSGFTTSQQLYQELSFSHYWQGNGTPLGVMTRGYQMIQAAPTTVAGVSVDPDQALADNLQGQVVWLVTQPCVPAAAKAV
ncbi:MAG: DUF1906 domain-containing protein [Minicystis sp.]